MNSIDHHFKQLVKEAVREVLLSEIEKGTFTQFQKSVTPVRKFELKKKNKLEPWTIIRPKKLAEYLSVALSTLYRMEANGELPPKIRLTARTVGWRFSDIEDWIESRKQATHE